MTSPSILLHRRLYEHLTGILGSDSVFDRTAEPLPSVEVRPDRLREAVASVRGEPFSAEFLDSVNGIDLTGYPGPESIRDAVPWRMLYNFGAGVLMIVYQLYSIEHRALYVIKTVLPSADPRIDTIDDLYGNANWLERETYDLLGIVFTGSRDLRRLLLPANWEGYPLRKDYVQKDLYDGMSTRAGAFTLTDADREGTGNIERWMREEAENQ